MDFAFADVFLELCEGGAGSVPLKPPMAITGSPEASLVPRRLVGPDSRRDPGVVRGVCLECGGDGLGRRARIEQPTDVASGPPRDRLRLPARPRTEETPAGPAKDGTVEGCPSGPVRTRPGSHRIATLTRRRCRLPGGSRRPPPAKPPPPDLPSAADAGPAEGIEPEWGVVTVDSV